MFYWCICVSLSLNQLKPAMPLHHSQKPRHYTQINVSPPLSCFLMRIPAINHVIFMEARVSNASISRKPRWELKGADKSLRQNNRTQLICHLWLLCAEDKTSGTPQQISQNTAARISPWLNPLDRQGSKIFPGMVIPIIKIRRSSHHLIFMMGIPILVKQHLYIETASRALTSWTHHLTVFGSGGWCGVRSRQRKCGSRFKFVWVYHLGLCKWWTGNAHTRFDEDWNGPLIFTLMKVCT